MNAPIRKKRGGCSFCGLIGALIFMILVYFGAALVFFAFA